MRYAQVRYDLAHRRRVVIPHIPSVARRDDMPVEPHPVCANLEERATARWIVRLHLSACHRWLGLDPTPLSEVAETMAVILQTVRSYEPAVDTSDAGRHIEAASASCPLDRARCLAAVAALQTFLASRDRD